MAFHSVLSRLSLCWNAAEVGKLIYRIFRNKDWNCLYFTSLEFHASHKIWISSLCSLMLLHDTSPFLRSRKNIISRSLLHLTTIPPCALPPTQHIPPSPPSSKSLNSFPTPYIALNSQNPITLLTSKQHQQPPTLHRAMAGWSATRTNDFLLPYSIAELGVRVASSVDLRSKLLMRRR